MGGELMVLFENGEKRYAMDFFKRACRDEDFAIVGKDGYDCWIDKCSGARLDIGYTMGELNNEWAVAIGAQLAKRTRIKKFGWDSIGFIEDEPNFPLARRVPFRVSLNNYWRVATEQEHVDSFISEGIKRYTALQGQMVKEAWDFFEASWQYRSLEERFYTYVNVWKDETRVSSKHEREHHAFQALVEMGEEALPFIFQHMSRWADWVFIALWDILGRGPEVPPDTAGWLTGLVDLWLEWARAEGLTTLERQWSKSADAIWRTPWEVADGG